jgi:HK97 family phage portal protein
MGLLDKYIQRKVEAALRVSKTAGFMELESATYPDGQPDMEKIANFSSFTDAYRKLPWLYAGVTAIAIASTKCPLKVYRQGTKKNAAGKVSQEEVEGTPLNDLLERPNDFLTWRELLQITIVNLTMSGNAYWNLVGTSKKKPVKIGGSNPPIELWWVKPEQIQPKLDTTGAVVAYKFTSASGSEKTLDPSEIIHFRLPNPGSYHLGMGMMEPATNTAILELDAVTFQRNYLQNDGTPPLILEHPGEPNTDERKRFWASWDERHRGPKKAGRTAMLWGGMRANPIGSSIKDAQYPELRKMNREEMLATAGVPPSVVGLLEYANYSNMEVQQRKFWEDTVIPVLDTISDKITLGLAALFNEQFWVDFDYSKIKVLQEDLERMARIGDMLVRSGIKTPNQVRVEMYNAEPYVGGDKYYIALGLVEVGVDPSMPTSKETQAQLDEEREASRLASEALAAANAAKEEGDSQPEGEPESEPEEGEKSKSMIKASYWRDDARNKALYGAFEKRVTAKERRMIPAVEKFLRQQATHVKRRLSKFSSLDGVRAADLFDVDAEMKLYMEKFEAHYVSAFEDAGEAGFRATKGAVWLPDEEKAAREFKIKPEALAKLKAQIELAARYFNETTWEKIKADIEQAKLDGDTVEELTQDLWEHLDNLSTSRARLISRTEMARTENWGGIEGYRQNKFINRKGWMCSFVADSREEHKAAHGQEVDLDAEFSVGGEMLAYPGASGATAENVCNCLCGTYPVVEV